MGLWNGRRLIALELHCLTEPSWKLICSAEVWIKKKNGWDGNQLGYVPAFSLLWYPVWTFLSSFPQDSVWPRQSLSLNQKSLYRRQTRWPWTAHIAPVRVIIICSGTNSLPVGRRFSLFTNMLMNNRMQPTTATLWTSRKKPKPSVSGSQTPSWRMLQCISVLTVVHSEMSNRERLTETSGLSICAEVGGSSWGNRKSLTSPWNNSCSSLNIRDTERWMSVICSP